MQQIYNLLRRQIKNFPSCRDYSCSNLTFHVQLQFIIVKESHVDPTVNAARDLFVVNDVVPEERTV